MTTAGDIFLAVLAVFFPPLAVWVKRGICSCDSLLNILLCMLAYLPGLLHSWYIIAKYPDGYEAVPGDADYEAAAGTHRVIYYYSTPNQPQPQPAAPGNTGAPDGGKAQRQIQRNPSYGAVGPSSGEPSAPAADGANAPPTYAEAVKGDNKVQGP